MGLMRIRIFFNDVARRSIFLLAEQFRFLKGDIEHCNKLYLTKLLAWLGVARAIVDDSNQELGRCLDCSRRREALFERWGGGNSCPSSSFYADARQGIKRGRGFNCKE